MGIGADANATTTTLHLLATGQNGGTGQDTGASMNGSVTTDVFQRRTLMSNLRAKKGSCRRLDAKHDKSYRGTRSARYGAPESLRGI